MLIRMTNRNSTWTAFTAAAGLAENLGDQAAALQWQSRANTLISPKS